VAEAADDDRERTWLLSDLHVKAGGGEVLDDLGNLLGRAAGHGSQARVLILGDLFDSYVGCGQLATGAWAELARMLRDTVAAGVSISVLCGNRDFLLDPGFEEQTGCRVVRGCLRLVLDGCPTLALHGDELCLRDHPYQRSKGLLRHPVTIGLIRRLPLFVARALAEGVRNQSKKVVARGDQHRFRPPVWALRAAFAAGVERVIFGHIHWRVRGQLEGSGDYWVLPAFDEGGIHLGCGPGDLRFCDPTGDALPDPPRGSFT
jgi:UDP-2,3-diacylglucosamine hydrolase